MNMSVGKLLYVCVDDEPNGLAVIDALEVAMNANMSGDRQVMVSVESLAEAIGDRQIENRFVPIASEILLEARKQGCGDINIYC